MNNLPNFLIVGAAKSGTTTINYYLDNSKDVFMSDPKEPKYFSFKYAKYTGLGDESFTKKKAIKTLEDYEKLYTNVNGHKCIGEASVDNLFYHSSVIPDIQKTLNNPKIIILLRHPVDRAISAYSHLIRDGRENLSFKKALEVEDQRLNDGNEFIWGYKKGGLYYEQVKSYIDNFKEVKIYFFEDLLSSPQRVMDDITSFLEVSPICVKENLKLNISGKPKNKILNILVARDTVLRRMMAKLVGKNTAIKIKSFIQKKNLNKISVEQEIKTALNKHFIEDITKLQTLLGKDLSSWINKY